MKGWPPDPSSFAQSVQHGIPDVRLDIRPHVLIETSARAAVVVAYFEGFSYPHIVCESSFVLPLHVMDSLKVICVESVLAVLVMLSDTRVLPFFFFYCIGVFVLSDLIEASSLANVC